MKHGCCGDGPIIGAIRPMLRGHGVTSQHAPPVRQHHPLGPSCGARGVGNGKNIVFRHTHIQYGIGCVFQQRLIFIAHHDDAFDTSGDAGHGQVLEVCVHKQHPCAGVFTQKPHLGHRRCRPNGGDSHTGRRQAADQLHVLQTIAHHQRSAVPMAQPPSSMGQVRNAVNSVDQLAIGQGSG